MHFLISKLNNNGYKLRKAIQFHQFSSKLLQIRAAERWAKFITPTRYYKSPVLPKDIVVRVTEKCFLKCKFCGQGGESGRVDRENLKESSIEIETFRKIINEASSWSVKPLIKITGGEPLVMGTALLDIIHEMRERGFIVKLNTNGMLLKSKKIARRVVDTDLNYLSISLDGGRDIHNKIRGNKRTFDAIMEGIDNIHGYRSELKKKNLMIMVSMMVSSETQDQIGEVYRVALNKKIDWFNVQLLNYTTPETCEQAHQYASSHFGIEDTPWDAFCNQRFNEIDSDLVGKQINDIITMRKSVPISVMGGLSSSKQIYRYFSTLEPIRKNICVLPFTGMHIVMPGKAVFCIDYPFYEYGDVRENTLESIWYGKRATDFRKDMIGHFKKYRGNYPQCHRCNWRFN